MPRRTSLTNVWNTAGAFIGPNGITKYSQCPVGVLNVVFHSSSSLIRTKWYAFLRSNLVKMVAPWSQIKGGSHQREGVPILYCCLVDSSVVDTGFQRSILLAREEETRPRRWWGGANDAGGQGLTKVFLHGIRLRSWQGKQTTSGGEGSPGFEVYYAVVGSVWS